MNDTGNFLEFMNINEVDKILWRVISHFLLSSFTQDLQFSQVFKSLLYAITILKATVHSWVLLTATTIMTTALILSHFLLLILFRTLFLFHISIRFVMCYFFLFDPIIECTVIIHIQIAVTLDSSYIVSTFFFG